MNLVRKITKTITLRWKCFGLFTLLVSLAPTGAAHADTWVSPTGAAEGACLASGTGGIANGCFVPTFAISGTGTAGVNSCWKTALAISLLGSTCAAPDGSVLGVSEGGVAISGTGSASSDLVAVSGTGSASAPVAVTPLKTTYTVAGLPPCGPANDGQVINYGGNRYRCDPVVPPSGEAIWMWLPVV